jgi:hypothetical protein
LQAEVTWAREAATAAEAAHITTILAVEASAYEAVVAWDSATILIKDVEDWTTLVEREARERVLRVEVESDATLVSACEKVEGLVRKITLLEGDLVEVHWAREVVEENSHGLFDELTLL